MLARRRSRLLQPFNCRKGAYYEGLVATRAGVGENSSNNTVTAMMCRTGHVATCDIRQIRLAEANFFVNPTTINSEVQLGSPILPAAMGVRSAVEYNGGVVQIPWGGKIQGSVAPSDMGFSDSIQLPTMIPKGATFQIRRFLTATSGVPYNNWRDAAKGDLINYTSSPTDLTMATGAFTDSGTLCSTPAAIIGMTKDPSIIAYGDSIVLGRTDTLALTDFRRGVVCRAFAADTVAFLNHGLGSIQASTFLAGSPGRIKLWPYASHFIGNLGINDIVVGGISAAQLVLNLQAVWALMPARARIYQTTITPDSTSSGNVWLANGDQTTEAHNAIRVAANNLFRAGGIARLTDFFEVSWALESAHDNGLWLGDGVTTQKYTVDGVHPSPAGYALGAGAISAAKIYWP